MDTQSPSCLFCKIAAGEVPATIRYQNESVIAFDDIHPSMPTHILIAPKKHIVGLETIVDADGPWLIAMLLAARTLIDRAHLNEQYKLIANGPLIRHVDHLHFHLLAGPNLTNPKENLP